MELDIYAGPVQDIPYQSSLYFASGQAIINWCRSKTGFYSATDTYQPVGVKALTGDAVGVAVPYSPHCIVASGELGSLYQNEVTAHEIGHLFGMDHVSTHSLMYPAIDGNRQFVRSQINTLRAGPPLEP